MGFANGTIIVASINPSSNAVMMESVPTLNFMSNSLFFTYFTDIRSHSRPIHFFRIHCSLSFFKDIRSRLDLIDFFNGHIGNINFGDSFILIIFFISSPDTAEYDQRNNDESWNDSERKNDSQIGINLSALSISPVLTGTSLTGSSDIVFSNIAGKVAIAQLLSFVVGEKKFGSISRNIEPICRHLFNEVNSFIMSCFVGEYQENVLIMSKISVSAKRVYGAPIMTHLGIPSHPTSRNVLQKNERSTSVHPLINSAAKGSNHKEKQPII